MFITQRSLEGTGFPQVVHGGEAVVEGTDQLVARPLGRSSPGFHCVLLSQPRPLAAKHPVIDAFVS